MLSSLLLFTALQAHAVTPSVDEVDSDAVEDTDAPPPPTVGDYVSELIQGTNSLVAFDAQVSPATLDSLWGPTALDHPARQELLAFLALARGDEDLAASDQQLAEAEHTPGLVSMEDRKAHIQADPSTILTPAHLALGWELAAEVTPLPRERAAVPAPLEHETRRVARAHAAAVRHAESYTRARTALLTLLPDLEIPVAPPTNRPIPRAAQPETGKGRPSPLARRGMVRHTLQSLLDEGAVQYLASQPTGDDEVAVSPCTSAQLLHPSESKGATGHPLLAMGARPDKMLGKREVRFDGTLGEAFWRSLLTAWFGETAARSSTDGWRGDRAWIVHDVKREDSAFVTLVSFDNPATASAFADRMREWSATPELRGGMVLLDEQDVLFARGVPDKLAGKLVDKMWLTLTKAAVVCGP